MKPLVPYLRKSSKEDPALSRDRQSRTIKAWAKQHDVPLAAESWDPHVSGSKDWRQRALGEAIAAVERGDASGIVVEDLSRLTRGSQLQAAEIWTALENCGARLVSVADGIDTASGDQELNFGVRALLAREQWKQYARRMEHVKASRIERGVHIAGTVPVGYLRPQPGAGLEVDPVKAAAITEAFALRATGATFAEVARRLDESLPGGPGGRGVWNRNTVTRILTNRVYLGEARQGKHVNPTAHKALVTQQVWDTVQALARRSEKASNGTAPKSLLAGVCRCGSCGHSLDRNHVAKRYLAYRCRGRSAEGKCEGPATAMGPALEDLVTESVLGRLRDHAVEQVTSEVDVADFHRRLATARSHRATYEDPEFVAALGRDAALRTLAAINAEIASVEDALAAAIPTSPTTVAVQDVEAIWPGLTTDERREVISSMVEAVVVSRGVRGAPLRDRVRIYWKGDDLPFALPSRGRRKRSEVEAGAAAA